MDGRIGRQLPSQGIRTIVVDENHPGRFDNGAREAEESEAGGEKLIVDDASPAEFELTP